MNEANTWTVWITFSEHDDRTRADAALEGAPVQLSGFGTSRRNPVDPNLPAVGEEIAAARALEDLSHLFSNGPRTRSSRGRATR